MMRRCVLLAVIFLLSLSSVFFELPVVFSGNYGMAQAVPQALPGAKREEAERHLLAAYSYMVHQRYWKALDSLELALQNNTYLVDYYLMKGLILRRLGETASAVEALSHYLEVRPAEHAPSRIFEALVEEVRFLEQALDGDVPGERFSVLRHTSERAFSFPGWTPFTPLGMGKMTTAGSLFFLADTEGNKTWIVREGGRVRPQIVSSDSPVAVIPRNGESFLVVGRNGDIGEGSLDATGHLSGDVTPRGSLGIFVADAVPLSGNTFCVADWGERRLSFVDFPSLQVLWNWSPETGTLLQPFEPVALAGLGELLAVADRGRGRVLLLNTRTRTTEAEIDELGTPRDIAWTPWGSLLILDERGNLYTWKSGTPPELLVRLEGAWTLDVLDGRPFALHVSGKYLWEGQPFPPVNAGLFMLNLFTPSVTHGSDPEAILQGHVGFPAQEILRRQRTYTSAAWMGKQLQGNVRFLHRSAITPLVLLAPGKTLDLPGSVVLQDGGVLLPVLRRSGWDMGIVPTDIILDTGIPFSRDDLRRLLALALHNGIRVHLWAPSQIPSRFLARLMLLTGGRLLVSETLDTVAAPDPFVLEMRFPLPVDAFPSGYPSGSMLSVFVDSGEHILRDWFPFWPSGLRSEEGASE
jgi:hypothetical protein